MTKKQIKRIAEPSRVEEMIRHYEEVDFFSNEFLFGEDDFGNTDGTWWYEGCHLKVQTAIDLTFESPVYNAWDFVD